MRKSIRNAPQPASDTTFEKNSGHWKYNGNHFCARSTQYCRTGAGSLKITSNSAPDTVYFMGDSLTADGTYPNQVGLLLGNLYGISNKGIGGQNTTQMLARFATDITNHADCKYVVIFGGTNDIAGSSVATIESNLQAMYTVAHNAGIKVVALTITPRGYTGQNQTNLLAVNAWILNAAINIDYKIDAYTLLNDPNNTGNLNFYYDSGDHLHLNSYGYTLLGNAVFNGVSQWYGNGNCVSLPSRFFTPFVAGSDYLVKVYAYGDNASSTLTMQCGDKVTKGFVVYSATPGTFTEQDFTFQATALTIGQPIQLYLNGAGNVFVDDISISKISSQSIQIANAMDDARVVPGWGNYFDSVNCDIGNEAGSSMDTGFRFLGLNVPKNATIVNAYIGFTTNGVGNVDNVNVRIKAEANATPATFSTYADFVGRTRSTAYIDWSAIPHWLFWTVYNTPDIKTVIQEVVNLAGWNAGQNITLFIADNGSTGTAKRYIDDYGNGPSGAAILYVTWSIP